MPWGSMRNQEFHKGVDGLKSLGTPDLKESHSPFSCYGRIKANSAGKNLNVTNINTKKGMLLNHFINVLYCKAGAAALSDNF